MSLFLTTDLTCQVANTHLENNIYFEFWLTICITIIRNYILVPCQDLQWSLELVGYSSEIPDLLILKQPHPFNNANRNPNYDGRHCLGLRSVPVIVLGLSSIDVICDLCSLFMPRAAHLFYLLFIFFPHIMYTYKTVRYLLRLQVQNNTIF